MTPPTISPEAKSMKETKVKSDGIEIGSTVKFIHENVNWQGTVMDIRHMMHAPPMLCVTSLGYPKMLYMPKGHVTLVPKL